MLPLRPILGALALAGSLACSSSAPRAQPANPPENDSSVAERATSSAARAVSPADSARPWTFLVYAAVDNDAESGALWFLDSIAKALDEDPGVEFLLFLDRRATHETDPELFGAPFSGSRLYRVHARALERLDGAPEFPELRRETETELDSADADTLRRFVDFGKRVAPARHTALLVYGHADGRSMCPDETSGHAMSIAGTSAVLGPRESLDFLGLELCDMATLEVAYQWRPGPQRFGANVLVAIPGAGPPLDWARAFERLRTPGHAPRPGAAPLDPAALDATALAKLVIEEGRRGREAEALEPGTDVAREAAVAVDLRRIEPVARALGRWAVALSANDSRAALLALREREDAGHALVYDRGGPFVDLGDLARRAGACSALAAPVREAARELESRLAEALIASFGMPGLPGFVAGRSGLAILLPRADTGPRKRRWRTLLWYSPNPFVQAGTSFGGWELSREGALEGNGAVENWYELLDSWFDEQDEHGGLDHRSD